MSLNGKRQNTQIRSQICHIFFCNYQPSMLSPSVCKLAANGSVSNHAVCVYLCALWIKATFVCKGSFPPLLSFPPLAFKGLYNFVSRIYKCVWKELCCVSSTLITQLYILVCYLATLQFLLSLRCLKQIFC